MWIVTTASAACSREIAFCGFQTIISLSCVWWKKIFNNHSSCLLPLVRKKVRNIRKKNNLRMMRDNDAAV